MLTLALLTDQVQKYWNPQWETKLREQLMLAGLVSKKYDGQIKEKGDSVTVSSLGEIEGELKTVGDADADVFSDETPEPEKITIVANKIASGAVKMANLAQLQSLIEQGVVGERITRAIAKKINTYLYTIFAESSTTPDHVLTASAITATELAQVNRLFAESYVDGPVYGLISPQYWEAMSILSGFTSADYVDDSPILNGQKARRLLGMQLYQDNSRTGKAARFFTPDVMHYVSQTTIETKVSDLHAMKQRGILISSEIVFGAKLGLQGNLKSVVFTG